MASQAKIARVAINNILLATDFSPASENAFYCAVSLAKRHQSTVFLTHVLPTDAAIAAGAAWPELADAMQHNAENSMAQLEAIEEMKSVPHITIIQSGDPWVVMAEVVAEKNIDLIVIGTHGHGGVKKLLLGSTAERVVRHAGCPVLTVGPHVEFTALTRFSHILFASDFLSGSMHALNYALRLAEEDGADLTFLHVIEAEPASETELMEWKAEDREKLRQMIPPDIDLACPPEIEIEVGLAGTQIVRMADTRKADLIVMGSHPGGAAATHFPWTTLHHVLQQTRCAVLSVRAQ